MSTPRRQPPPPVHVPCPRCGGTGHAPLGGHLGLVYGALSAAPPAGATVRALHTRLRGARAVPVLTLMQVQNALTNLSALGLVDRDRQEDGRYRYHLTTIPRPVAMRRRANRTTRRHA
jgi:Fe2+ or Zn2+ uptake regulation protein